MPHWRRPGPGHVRRTAGLWRSGAAIVQRADRVEQRLARGLCQPHHIRRVLLLLQLLTNGVAQGVRNVRDLRAVRHGLGLRIARSSACFLGPDAAEHLFYVIDAAN